MLKVIKYHSSKEEAFTNSV